MAVRFEPYVLYQETPLSGSGTSIWGEFLPASGEGLEQDGTQEEGAQRAFDGLRGAFPGAWLVFDGEVPRWLGTTRIETVRSKLTLDQHNGRWVRGGPWDLRLAPVQGLPTVAVEALMDRGPSTATRGIALLLSVPRIEIGPLRTLFEQASETDALEARLLEMLSATFALDHEAFFTFETHDSELASRVRAFGRPRPTPIESSPSPPSRGPISL